MDFARRTCIRNHTTDLPEFDHGSNRINGRLAASRERPAEASNFIPADKIDAIGKKEGKLFADIVCRPSAAPKFDVAETGQR